MAKTVSVYVFVLGQELRLNDLDKIKVLVIEPWAVDTPFWRHAANYTGVEQKFAILDEPDKVVNAVIRKSVRPKKIVPVGWKAQGSSFFANVFPRFNEWLTGNVAHKYQVEKALRLLIPKGQYTNRWKRDVVLVTVLMKE